MLKFNHFQTDLQAEQGGKQQLIYVAVNEIITNLNQY